MNNMMPTFFCHTAHRRRLTTRLVQQLAVCFSIFFSAAFCSADTVEFLSGATLEGKVLEIRKDAKEFDVEVTLGGQKAKRTYRFDQVHAVTLGTARHVLTPKTAGAAGAGGDKPKRTKPEVLALIQQAGSTPPDWFAATPLKYPKTLDLDWPLEPPSKGWNNQVNVGQYKWDVINPNPGRWQEGIKLVHEIMQRHENNPVLLKRDMEVLGTMYFELFQDYARAAFWFQKAGVKLPDGQAISLAECYWRLGNQQMALEVVGSKSLPISAIKLLGDMGQTDRAVKLATAFAKAYPDRAAEPLLLAGDACRAAGRFDDAIRFYNMVLQGGNARNKEYEKIYTGRAKDSIEAIELFEKTDPAKIADGTYSGESTGYTGVVKVEVVVDSGRIEKVAVVSHSEKQFYAALTDTPAQIIDKQSVRGIDATSRATITSQAIVNATAEALASGAK